MYTVSQITGIDSVILGSVKCLLIESRQAVCGKKDGQQKEYSIYSDELSHKTFIALYIFLFKLLYGNMHKTYRLAFLKRIFLT